MPGVECHIRAFTVYFLGIGNHHGVLSSRQGVKYQEGDSYPNTERKRKSAQSVCTDVTHEKRIENRLSCQVRNLPCPLIECLGFLVPGESEQS